MGETKNKANLSPAELELGLSLAIFRKYDKMTSNWLDMGSSLTPNDVIAR